MDALKIKVYPTHVIIGRDGKVIKSNAGGIPGIEDVLKKDVQAALKDPVAVN